jgi:hypothetical protein
MKDLRDKLKISQQHLDDINALLLDPDSSLVNALLEVVHKYGSPDEINRKADEARKLPNLMARLRKIDSPYVRDLDWLIQQRDRGAFISEAEYRHQVVGHQADQVSFADDFAVTLEVKIGRAHV